MKFVAQFRSVD